MSAAIGEFKKLESGLMQKSYRRVGLIAVLFSVPFVFLVSAVMAETGASSSDQSTGLQSKGQAIFSENCAVCHTPGEGDATVPDLKGVTLRRTEAWLKSFIQSPAKMFEAKDPVAVELLAKYKEPMSDSGLTPEDVDAVVEYLETMDKEIKPSQGAAGVVVSLPSAGGETSSGQKVVTKRTATKAEVEQGKAFFWGERRFLHGGPSCFACHDLRNSTSMGAGRLAKELAAAYARLGEVRLRSILEKAPFPLMREAYGENPLTADEVSDLCAFLEQVDKKSEEGVLKRYGDAMPLIGLAGFAILLGLYGVLWSNRRNRSVNKSIYDRQIRSKGVR